MKSDHFENIAAVLFLVALILFGILAFDSGWRSGVAYVACVFVALSYCALSCAKDVKKQENQTKENQP